ncbi:amidohydrolase family protein [Cellulomonas sp. SG140]|uniref:amidohydrolase family protein n=1 Tax=Cellulomonas sp. SG140 TaxID=2976536 RepID=UPI0021E9AB01|nr:amidohydrolase [Cellulomonas sp. SG140]
MTVRLVDAHVHLWDLDRHGLSWFRADLGLPRRALGSDLRAVAGAGPLLGVGVPLERAVAVQAGDGDDEVRWLTAQRDGVVGAVVLQHVPEQRGCLEAATAVPGGTVRGVRVAVPGRAEDLGDVPGLDALMGRAAELGVVVEFLVRWEQLAAVALLAARHPATSVVVCHLGLGSGALVEGWARGLAQLAAQANAAAKVSGVVTAAAGDSARMAQVVATAVDAFGLERLMFGSDWPISARVAPYPQIVARTAAALPTLTATETAAFWGGTAARLYRL